MERRRGGAWAARAYSHGSIPEVLDHHCIPSSVKPPQRALGQCRRRIERAARFVEKVARLFSSGRRLQEHAERPRGITEKERRGLGGDAAPAPDLRGPRVELHLQDAFGPPLPRAAAAGPRRGPGRRRRARRGLRGPHGALRGLLTSVEADVRLRRARAAHAAGLDARACVEIKSSRRLLDGVAVWVLHHDLLVVFHTGSSAGPVCVPQRTRPRI